MNPNTSTETDATAIEPAAVSKLHSRNYRPVAVRVRPPPDDAAVGPVSIPARLTRAIRDCFNSAVSFDAIEFLSFPSGTTQTFVLTATVSTVPRVPGEGDGTSLHDSVSERGAPVEGTLQDAGRVLLEKLEVALPRSFTVEPVSVRFDPLGVSSVTTSRVINRRNRRIAPAEHQSMLAFERTISQHLRNRAHLYQTIITPHSNDQLKLSTRVATFEPVHQIDTDGKLARVIEDGLEFDPAAPFGEYGLTTQLAALPRFLKVFRFYTPNIYPKGSVRAANRTGLPALAKGLVEYRDLLQGRRGGDAIYEDLIGYPSLVVRDQDLAHFADIIDADHDSDPWAAVPGRDAPAVEPIAFTNERLEHPAPPSSATDTGVSNEGGRAHQWLVERTAQIQRERGAEAIVVEQDASSVPDLISRGTEGALTLFEIESKNRRKPANVFVNIARARELDCAVTVVVSSRNAASWVANRLQKPFREIDDERTLLYNWTETVTVDDGGQPVIPSDAGECRWWLTPDGTLELEIDGTTVATGDAETSTSAFEYRLPTHWQDGDGHVVQAPDGEVLNRYDSVGECREEWSSVYVPHVPVELHYLERTTIMYLDDGDLVTYEPSAHWDVEDHERRYEGALEAGFDTYTAQVPGERVGKSEVRRVLLRWYRQLTDRKPPNKAYFGRASPDWLNERANNREDGKYWFFDDLTWRFPRGLQSPDLPTFGSLAAVPGLPEAWVDEPAGLDGVDQFPVSDDADE